MITLAERETTSGVTLFLSAGLTLSGRVTERGTKRSLAAVEITSGWGSQARMTSTTADGRYRLTGIHPKAQIPIRIHKKGWRLAGASPSHEFAPSVTISVPPGEQHLTENFELEALNTLRGRVISETGKPVIGASLRLETVQGKFSHKPVVSGPEGGFEFEVPPHVSAVIHAWLPDTPRRVRKHSGSVRNPLVKSL